MLRSIIGSDMDLAHLFTMQLEPTVYLVHNQNIECTQPEPFTVHDVLSDDWWRSGSDKEPQYEVEPAPNTDAAEGTAFYDATSTDYAGGGSSFHDARNDNVVADDNGVVETDDDNDDEADLDGGINELLSMLVSTNQPTSSSNQVKPEAEDVRNWIIQIIPLDCTDSPVVHDLDHIIDEPLRKGSVFYTKEYIYVVVGLWHMERKAEFKVPRSCGSRVEYTCKRNPSCTFELRVSWRGSYWIVHKFNMQHMCNLDLGSVGARNVRAKAVAAYYTRKMRREEIIMKP
ncbi:hypothetical protein C2S53_018682 [Perilla frutescens var. hirtella]|uniref:Transposase MuDR plant domain-containing protein n=1 Tax=Perilla frutescens var. hirtella TaxID=608512 RepID=A0AAD4PB97_PERFH|nr:hypothetical protein C2S53_018682 [Perilla frutescens var. hirtella]